MPKILISILNWNASDSTIACVDSLLSDHTTKNLDILIRIIDNGSNPTEVAILKTLRHPIVELHFNAINNGFTGGQNSNIQYALEHDFDFFWMLNNDTSVPPGTITRILECFSQDERCGAVSPRIVRMGDPATVDFCGAVHDWAVVDNIRPESLAQAPLFLQRHENHIWAVGTALMLRTSTIRDIGPLDNRLFAYYDDDDLGARLIAAGWRTRIALDAHVEHACFEGDMYRRAPYFFYLMTRNALLFALTHTPTEHRRLLRSRFIDRSLFRAEKLLKQGQKEKADACLLGLADGLARRGGPPNLTRKVPLWLRGLQPIGRLWNQSRGRA